MNLIVFSGCRLKFNLFVCKIVFAGSPQLSVDLGQLQKRSYPCVPGKEWVFDAGVSDCISDMLFGAPYEKGESGSVGVFVCVCVLCVCMYVVCVNVCVCIV